MTDRRGTRLQAAVVGSVVAAALLLTGAALWATDFGAGRARPAQGLGRGSTSVAAAVGDGRALAGRNHADAIQDVGPPLVVVLGDSTAGTIGDALRLTAPARTTVANDYLFGCALAIGSWASDQPPLRQLPTAAPCNESTPAWRQWPAVDARAVSGTAPGDVVLFVGGNWESEDILQAGRWSNITQPSFQRYLLVQLTRVIAIGAVHGAHVELATLPAMYNGTLGDSPVRRRIYNRLVEQAVSKSRGRASVVDLAGILSPGGRFTLYLDGVQVRTRDGIHTPTFAPGNIFLDNSPQPVAAAFDRWLAPRLWPEIMAPDRDPGAHRLARAESS